MAAEHVECFQFQFAVEHILIVGSEKEGSVGVKE